MRLGLAGGVIVVLVVFAIVMLQPGSQRLATAFSGLNPPGAQLQDGSCSFAERVFCRASAICP